MAFCSLRSLLLAALCVAAAPRVASPAGRSMGGSGPMADSAASKQQGGSSMGSKGHTRDPKEQESLDKLDAAVTAACNAPPDPSLGHPMEPCVNAYLKRAEAHKDSGNLLLAFEDMKSAKKIAPDQFGLMSKQKTAVHTQAIYRCVCV